MRSAVIAAAFAAGTAAVPYNKRDVVVDTVTDVDVVYATAYVTVTAGEAEPTSTSTLAAVSSASQAAHFGHHSYHWASTWSSATTWTVEASSAAPAPASSEAPSSSYVAPPAPTTTSTSIYVAPTTKSSAAPSSAAPSSYAAPSSSAVSSAAAAQPTSYQQKAVLHHNIHRANHSAPDLEWSDALESTAAKIAASCVYAHNTAMDGGGYGQNIAAGVEGDNITAVITDLFYNGEVGYYDNLYGEAQPDMTNFEFWGHFSQIVWKSTTKFACVTQDCTAQGLANVGSDVSPYFTVCNYETPGNYANEYASNVGKPLFDATADWNYGL